MAGGGQPWDDFVLVGRVARPHGIRGQVVVTPDTDFVDQRFRAGATLWIRSDRGPERLTVGSVRLQGGRPVVGFEGFLSIEDAQRLLGRELRVPEEDLVPLEADRYYHHQLLGCVVETSGGERVGPVRRVEGGSGASLLSVEGARGEVLIPFTERICVHVDVAGRRITIDPPDGLLELNESDRASATARRATSGE